MADEKKKQEGAGALARREFEQEITKRARADSTFRRQLLENPKQALKDAFDVQIPPEVELYALEETRTKLYVVLPCESAGLSDSDLDRIAGGGTSLTKRLM